MQYIYYVVNYVVENFHSCIVVKFLVTSVVEIDISTQFMNNGYGASI